MFLNSPSGGVVGSSNIQTSVGNQEILSRILMNFEFTNDQACHVIIEDRDPIYIRAGQGIALGEVSSFKIQESGITFNWIGEFL